MNNKSLFNKYVDKIHSLNDENFNLINKEIFNGKNSILRLSKKGSSIFDPSWIDKIEDCLYDLGEIINNPREVTAQESSVVPIELAKKVDGESVQHLASHTQFIKDINESGEVMPGKILSHFNKQELHTYENRFIATFVRRLVLFIEKRYDFIKKTVNLETKDVLMMKNTSSINGQEVEIETKITVTKEIADDVARRAKEYINRIELMREYVSYYYNSRFMHEMKNERDVRKPILQTNIIRKNPLYHKCFEVFMFIERFESLGVSFKVDEEYYSFSEDERARLNYLLLSQYLGIQDTEEYEVIKESHKVYKPKVLSSIDDERFVYGDLLEGPVEFVRVDEGYKKYLAGQIRNDLPLHPSKEEKMFYSEEYQYKKALLEKLKEIDRLIARVEKEEEKWEKEVQRIIENRDLEEKQEAERKLEELNRYHQSLIEEKRKLIIAAAKDYKEQMPTIMEQELEEIQKEIEEKENKVDKVYHVSATSKYEYINGHLEQTLYLSDETDSSEYVEISSKKEKEEIQGSFIVKTPHGYYVSENKFSNIRGRAHVFSDINQANQVKNLLNGKVIKL